MPSINLVSVQRSYKRTAERKTRALFFGWIAEAAMFIFLIGFLLFRSASLEAQLSEVNARAQKLAPIVKQIETTQKEIAIIQPKLLTLQNARVDTDRWERILHHISVNTPTHTWVTSLRSDLAKDEKTPTTMSVSGFAADQNLVGEEMMRLGSSPDLERVELKYSQAKANDTRTGVEFEIGSTLKGTAKPTPDPKEGAKDAKS